MKKVLLLMVFAGLAVSCGPKRLGCGPGRCEVVKAQKKISKPC